MASLVLYMYKMWLLAGWRVHGQVSSITYNIYFIFRSFLKNWTRLLLLNCIKYWASRFRVNLFCHKLCSMEINHCPVAVDNPTHKERWHFSQWVPNSWTYHLLYVSWDNFFSLVTKLWWMGGLQVCCFFAIFRDGKPYCEKDYQAEFGVTCAGCGGYIIGKVLQVK